jgi:hypothetical protein
MVMIFQIEVVEAHGPLYIWWSGIATEYQSYGLLAYGAREANRIATVNIT